MNIVKAIKNAIKFRASVKAKFGAYITPESEKAKEKARKKFCEVLEKARTVGIPKARRGEVWDLIHDATGDWDLAQRIAYGYNPVIDSKAYNKPKAEARYMHHSCHSVSDWH